MLAGHEDWVRAVALGRLGDREVVVSGSGDGTVRIWGIPDRPSTLASYDSDTDAGRDALGIERDVRALVDLVARRRTEPPLSIGLFGDWGSGKSLFMRRMRERTRELGDETRVRAAFGEASEYHADVRSIVFNAWHYADANLWASVTTHIFEELARPDPAEDAGRAGARHALLMERLAGASGRAERLRTAEEHARRARASRRLARLAGLDLGDRLVVRPAGDDPVEAAYGAFAGRVPSTAELRAQARADEAAASRRRGRRA